MHARCEFGIAREALRQPTRIRRRLVVIRMRRNQRCAGRHGGLDRPVDSLVDGDEAPETDSESMSREGRIGVVVGQLETGNHEQAVALARPTHLLVDLGEIAP